MQAFSAALAAPAPLCCLARIPAGHVVGSACQRPRAGLPLAAGLPWAAVKSYQAQSLWCPEGAGRCKPTSGHCGVWSGRCAWSKRRASTTSSQHLSLQAPPAAWLPSPPTHPTHPRSSGVFAADSAGHGGRRLLCRGQGQGRLAVCDGEVGRGAEAGGEGGAARWAARGTSPAGGMLPPGWQRYGGWQWHS